MSARESDHTRLVFGTTTDGRQVDLHRLTSATGLSVEVITYGAAVHRVLVPAGGRLPVNVALGFPSLDGYLSPQRSYFGAIVGRYANRIAGGRFVLDGRTHELPHNDGENALHGGPNGFDTHIWEVIDSDGARLTLRTTSPDGDMGYPGTVVVDVTYTLTGDELRIDYHAFTDAPTIINLTNHTCWNLAGEGSGSTERHVLTVNASAYTPVGPGLIPTDDLSPVDDTPFDFREPTPIGARLRDRSEQLALARGYDHNFVLNSPTSGAITFAARLTDPHSGRVLEVHTTEPGLHLYTGNFLDGSVIGTSGRAYRQSDGVALETQHFPDSPNHARFPSTVLRPGASFASTTLFKFGTEDAAAA